MSSVSSLNTRNGSGASTPGSGSSHFFSSHPLTEVSAGGLHAVSNQASRDSGKSPSPNPSTVSVPKVEPGNNSSHSMLLKNYAGSGNFTDVPEEMTGHSSSSSHTPQPQTLSLMSSSSTIGTTEAPGDQDFVASGCSE